MDPIDELREDVEHLKSALNMLADAVFLVEEERREESRRRAQEIGEVNLSLQILIDESRATQKLVREVLDGNN